MSFLFKQGKAQAQDIFVEYTAKYADGKMVGCEAYTESQARSKLTPYEAKHGKIVWVMTEEEMHKKGITPNYARDAADSCAEDGVPTKFVGICHNGAKYYATATSVEQARKDVEEQAKKNGHTIRSVIVAEDAKAEDGSSMYFSNARKDIYEASSYLLSVCENIEKGLKEKDVGEINAKMYQRLLERVKKISNDVYRMTSEF